MIAILLATYNGERYLAEQLDSLINQTIHGYTIYVLDDCSTDGTRHVLEDYQKTYPDIIKVRYNSCNSGHAKYTFFQLLLSNDCEYVMFCDQDDVWKPDKIERSLERLKSLESTYSKDMPILVHTDLEVTDRELHTISPSMFSMMAIDPSRTKLNNLVSQNIMAGCTAMFNKALSKLITDRPDYYIMHDWWVLLVAASFGVVSCIQYPSILYRQHGNNVIGAKDINNLYYKLSKLMDAKGIRQALHETYCQTRCFLNTYCEHLSDVQRELLQEYAAIEYDRKLGRVRRLIQGEYLKNSNSRKLAHILFV